MNLEDVEAMIKAINQRVESFGKKYQPRYVKESKWRGYNKDRYSMERYLKASPSRRDVIERDLIKSIEYMPTAYDLKLKKDTFINNFNTALEKKGLDSFINNRNYIEFKDFVERYDDIITQSKYRDSAQIADLYKLYVNSKKSKYDDIQSFFKELLKRELSSKDDISI